MYNIQIICVSSGFAFLFTDYYFNFKHTYFLLVIFIFILIACDVKIMKYSKFFSLSEKEKLNLTLDKIKLYSNYSSLSESYIKKEIKSIKNKWLM